MRAERVVFTLLGVVLGAAAVWFLRGDHARIGADAVSDSAAIVRPTPPTPLPPKSNDLEIPPGAKDASTDETKPPPSVRYYSGSLTFGNGNPGGGFALVSDTQAGRSALYTSTPDWSALVTDDKLRYGTADEKAKALDVLRSATSKDYLPVAQRALEASTDANRTRELIGTIARLKDRPWSALQATGAPDTPISGDLATAWASAEGEMGEVTLDLTYDKAVRVDRVRIHETNAPGAIAKVQAKGPDGTWDTIWEGRALAGKSPNWFAPTVNVTRYTTIAIRLVLDTDRVDGWNEIDAVELEGDGIRQWATGATASSSYADR